MKHIKNFIFDLDDTLYPKSLGICHANWARLDDIFKTDKKYEFGLGHISYEEHKNNPEKVALSLNAGNFDWPKFVNYICDQDVSMIAPDPILKRHLERLPYPKIIYTNASKMHANNVLEKLGVADAFDTVFTCFDSDFKFKPMKQSFDAFFEKTGISPGESVFFEDSLTNITVAKKYGMTTVFISEDGAPQSDACDFVFSDINAALDIF